MTEDKGDSTQGSRVDIIDQVDKNGGEEECICDSSEEQSNSNTNAPEADKLTGLTSCLGISLVTEVLLMDNPALAYSSTILAFLAALRMARRSRKP